MPNQQIPPPMWPPAPGAMQERNFPQKFKGPLGKDVYYNGPSRLFWPKERAAFMAKAGYGRAWAYQNPQAWIPPRPIPQPTAPYGQFVKGVHVP